jgi:hypothetical protein
MDKVIGASPEGDQWENRQGILHSLPVNASSKLGYFNVTPFFNYTEKWYPQKIRKEFDATDSTVSTIEEKGFSTVRYFDTGVSMGTKLYGIVQPGIWGITGIRHQFTPSISYTYSPDWSDPKHGSWGSYTDASGTVVPYSFFESEIFGGAPSGERQAVGLRLGNVFEMKTEGADTAAEENKFQLLNLDASSSYNFARDSLKFDEISLGYRTAIGSILNIAGSSRFNLYQFDDTAGKRVNKFLLDTQGRLAQLTSFSISISTKLAGEKKKTEAGPKPSAADSVVEGGTNNYIGLYDDAKPDLSIPWQLDLTWNFSQNQSNPNVINKSSSLNASLGFNLTDAWKIRASGGYDLVNKELAAPQISVYRDLHCWEMNFTWVPTGIGEHYQIEIRLKSPLLQDVKVTKQQSSSGVF